ncbi:splicing factor 3A subunit 2-like protein [Gonapodya prolifera JEL478]|uniref:Splicing factor 3A subunit 2-like protein n=1 Tax=Gonapodya prolifera (strain JEL478) TaxID=1344416 RepID=A0A138ZZS8_GONPJ|nr:splicing factor 3A subunit 2-like protein [Gonapodya prolifera JEL478]|eukprot:KXS09918.1 splicing factor 3A subunit 2-like protein [Gonapodya prolifera JEL478]
MDFQNRAGSKPGSGGVAGYSESNVDRRERLRKLALETIDLAKDPYFMKNHLGTYECKLCLTLHTNEGSYLAHTQGKKHQTNLARRAAKDAKDQETQMPKLIEAAKPKVEIKRVAVKIGRPGYNVTKVRDPTTRQVGLLFQVFYPEIGEGIKPRHRFMNAFEQHQELPNRAIQYLIFAAEPYENVSFRVQAREIDRAEGRFWTYWDPDGKTYSLQFLFKNERPVGYLGGGGSGGPGGGPMAGNVMPTVGNPLNPYAPPPAGYMR